MLGKDEALQEARLRLAWIGGERTVDTLERLLRLPGLQKLLRVLNVVRLRERQRAKSDERSERHDTATQPVARGV